jgi:hypothetical protein
MIYANAALYAFFITCLYELVVPRFIQKLDRNGDINLED